MREVRVEAEVIEHAIVDAINIYMREVIHPRCPAAGAMSSGPEAEALLRLKYEIASRVAKSWAVSLFDENA